MLVDAAERSSASSSRCAARWQRTSPEERAERADVAATSQHAHEHDRLRAGRVSRRACPPAGAGLHAEDLPGLAARSRAGWSVLHAGWLTLCARVAGCEGSEGGAPAESSDPGRPRGRASAAGHARWIAAKRTSAEQRSLRCLVGVVDPDVLDAVVARGERAHLARQRLAALPIGASCGDEPAAWPRILQRLTQQRARLSAALTRAAEAEQRFSEITKPSARSWPDETAADHRTQLTAVAERATAALDRFRDWCLYQRQAESLAGYGLGGLVEAHAAGTVTWEQLAPSWERAVLTRWRKAAIDAEPALRDFSEVSHEHLVQDFGSHDSAHERLAREWIRGRLQERVPRAQTALKNSELDILRREIQKKARHVSIRKLFQQMRSYAQA